MRTKTLIIGVIAFLAVICIPAIADAQKKIPKKTPPVSKTIDLNNVTIPAASDFVFIVTIDKDLSVRANVQKANKGDLLATSDSLEDLADFFAYESRADFRKNDIEVAVIIRADENIEFGRLVKVIKSIYVSRDQKVKLQIGDDSYVAISSPHDKSDVIRPNPATLFAYLNADNSILLNRDQFGELSDTSRLITTLKEVFRGREANGIFKLNSNEVEKTTFVGADEKVKFSEVIKLINAVSVAGANPVALALENFVPKQVFF